MSKLSAMSVAGVLLLIASVPARAQGYPVDPGYDQGPDYGQSEAPAEDLPPGAVYGVDPGYGDPDQAYPEADYGYGQPQDGPVYGGEVQGWRHRHPDPRRYGEDFRRSHEGAAHREHRRVEEAVGRDGRDRNGEPRRRRQHPSNQDMPDR